MSKDSVLIDERAHVSAKAQLGKNVHIGPFAVIENECELGDNSVVHSHAVIKSNVKIGANCFIGNGAVIGADPQIFDKKIKKSGVIVQDGAVLREYVTIHRASVENQNTIVGKKCLLMVSVHLGHDVVLGKEVIIANFSQLAGHICVGDNAFISSSCLFHQNTRIGRLSITSAHSRITKDVLPFSMVGGYSAFYGINTVGLNRHKITANEKQTIKRFFKHCQKEGLEKVKTQTESLDCLESEILDFIKSSQRGVILNPGNKLESRHNV